MLDGSSQAASTRRKAPVRSGSDTAQVGSTAIPTLSSQMFAELDAATATPEIAKVVAIEARYGVAVEPPAG